MLNYKIVFNAHTGEPSTIYLKGTGFIPFDEGNRDYQSYLAWIEEGNVAEEWNPDANQ